MSCAKLLISFLIIFFMATSPLMAHGEITETSTEFVIESLQTTAAPSEEQRLYTTCDFDLENIESLLPYLPDICTEIYYNRNDSNLYDLYLEEAQNFAKFYKKLNDYELRNQSNGDKEEMAKYNFETKLRNDTYKKVDWTRCLTIANSSTVDYLNCLKSKRLEMTTLIPRIEKKLL